MLTLSFCFEKKQVTALHLKKKIYPLFLLFIDGHIFSMKYFMVAVQVWVCRAYRTFTFTPRP